MRPSILQVAAGCMQCGNVGAISKCFCMCQKHLLPYVCVRPKKNCKGAYGCHEHHVNQYAGAAQVLWARLLHMNGADMEEIRKGEPDMEDVLAYLNSGDREQAKKDATALLNELFAE